MNYVWRVFPYLRPYWPLGMGSVLATVLAALTSVATPWPMAILIDSVLGDKPAPELLARALGPMADTQESLLWVVVAAGVVVVVLEGLISVVSNFLNTKLEQGIVLDFRADLLQHAQQLSVPYADRVSTGRLMYGLNFEAAAAGSVILAVLPLTQSALTLIGMSWMSFQIDPLLAMLSLTIVPFLYYSVGYYAKRIQPQLLRVKGMEADALSIVHEAMQLLRVVTAFGRERHETQRFVAQGSRAVEQRVKLTIRQTLFSLAVSVITAGGTALVLGFGAHHALRGEISAGELLVVLSYVALVYKPLETISYTVGDLQDQLVGLQMAFHIRDTQPVVQDDPQAVAIERPAGHIEFEHVYFSYPERVDTLTDISFEARPGQVVAVVGPTGAGKTTLVNLIPRFYDPAQGHILLDGIDTRKITLRSLRDHISLVPQEPLLFSGTIAQNIRYGRLEADAEEILEAAQQANAHDFIMRLPNQYETTVGERGVQLSGGERQRICVARAFLKDAPILILDEPTASVDSRTETVILDALDRLMVGRTTFMIAHRLSTVRHADVILVVSDGRIVEQGAHDELIERDGLYKLLYRLQTGPARRRRIESASAYEDFPLSEGPTVALAERPDHSDWTAGLETEVARAMNRDAGSSERALPEGSSEPEPHAVSVRSLAAEYSSDPPSRWTPGGSAGYRVTLRNTGIEPWYATGSQLVRLAVHFGGDSDWAGDGWATDQRFFLPSDVNPGQSLTLDVDVMAPLSTGKYVLRHRLVKEDVAWFDQMQKVEVEVLGPPADPRSDPFAEAPLREVATGPVIARTKKILLLGMMSRHPVAGVVWQNIHYLVGLQRLGYEVYYVEAAGHQPSAMLPEGRDEHRSGAAADFIAGVMRRFDLGDRWAFHALHAGGECYGLSASALKDLYRSADLIINLHGATVPLPDHIETGRLVYLETDPVALQIELAQERQETVDFLKPHRAFFTFGENYGRPDCPLPVSDRFPFWPTRQPVVLDFWHPYAEGPAEVFTTIGNWEQVWRDIEFRGEIYRWSKHLEFLKFIDLPRRLTQPFELALSRCEEPARHMLENNGWRVRDSLGFSMDLDAYRSYIARSRGEFTVAKDQNVRLSSGWFSDRSATYLAAGRPVITQDTGFGNVLPTGKGLFSFTRVEEIVEAVGQINADYAKHSRAALSIAHEYFSYEVVLPPLLKQAGV